MNDRFDEIEYNDLTDDLKILADGIGIVGVRCAMRELSGMYFYIPKISRLENFVTRFVSEHKGMSRKEIAQYLDVSEQFLKKFRKY